MSEMKRIYHTWDKWECYPAGFYEVHPPDGMTSEEAEQAYRLFLSDLDLFGKCMDKVILEWKNSCEHYLTNERMNRIAWMGQAAMCIYSKVPSRFKGGYNLLTEKQQKSADELALEYINKWMKSQGYKELSHDEIKSKTVADLY